MKENPEIVITLLPDGTIKLVSPETMDDVVLQAILLEVTISVNKEMMGNEMNNSKWKELWELIVRQKNPGAN